MMTMFCICVNVHFKKHIQKDYEAHLKKMKNNIHVIIKQYKKCN